MYFILFGYVAKLHENMFEELLLCQDASLYSQQVYKICHEI